MQGLPFRSKMWVGRWSLVLGACLGLACTGEAATVRLHPTAGANGPMVRLGDVAEILEADEAQTVRLASVVLGPSPSAGRSTNFEFAAIRGRLQACGIDVSRLEFSGASVVAVQSSAAPAVPTPRVSRMVLTESASRIVAERLGQVLAGHVNKQAPELGGVLVRMASDDEVYGRLAAIPSAAFQIAGGQAPWLGTQTFHMQYADNTGRGQTVELTGEVSLLPRVVVARSALDRGKLIAAEDLTLEPRHPSSYRGEACVQIDAVVGCELVRPIRAGETLCESHVRALPLVRRGDVVTVLCRRAGITVRMDAKAMDDGALGDAIKLRSLDHKQDISATVTAYHEAELRGNAGPIGVPGTGARLVGSP